MDEPEDRELLRMLSGKLTPEQAEALRQRLAGDAERSARLASWSAAWNGLEEPPGRGVPPGFATAVMARARAEAAGGSTFAQLPLWTRAVAAASLAVGIVAGAAIGTLSSSTTDSGDEVAALWSDPGFGEGLWLAAEGQVGAVDGLEVPDDGIDSGPAGDGR